MPKIIISASRRTDIPRYYYQWLQRILAEGRVDVANPRFPEKVYHVDLRPENVHSLVLWSKDFSQVLSQPGCLENYHLYFQFTINGYSPILEPQVPDYPRSLKILEGLLKIYRPEQFNIRFDPVILSTTGELLPNREKPGRARLAVFERLCRDLASLGMNACRVTTSYVAMYGHVRKRLFQAGIDLVPLDERLQAQFFERMADIAARSSLPLFSCASPALTTVPGIRQGRCIDGGLLETLFGGRVSKAKDTGQRGACKCHKSTDIGDYTKRCFAGCRYCYAFRGDC